MADVITSNYNFTIPDIAGSDDTWGIKLNANWGLIDTLLFNMSLVIGNKVDNGRVLTDVPANAVFTDTNTDTIYTKPISEEIAYINGLQSALDQLNNEVTQATASISSLRALALAGI